MTATLIELDTDPSAFLRVSLERGWGDGLPLIPPTPELVETFLAATDRDPEDVVAALQPSKAECTVEKIAINAAMAGAPAEAMPLLIAAIEAAAVPDFNVAAQNATTAPVVPIYIVNGPIRHSLNIPFQRGCFGGMEGPAPAIGRAVRLIIRNIAGQHLGSTSESIFGQPGRVVGLTVGEWEEESPWEPLSTRRGVPGNAITAFGSMGTTNICDTVAEKADHIIEMIGKSLAYIGANGYVAANGKTPGEVVVALNPVWAKIIGAQYPNVLDAQAVVFEHSAVPINWFPADYRKPLEDFGRVKSDGRIHVVNSPEDVILFVAGGMGSLHATALHGFGHSFASTVSIDA
jgi:hypothetical protein